MSDERVVEAGRRLLGKLTLVLLDEGAVIPPREALYWRQVLAHVVQCSQMIIASDDRGATVLHAEMDLERNYPVIETYVDSRAVVAVEMWVGDEKYRAEAFIDSCGFKDDTTMELMLVFDRPLRTEVP